MSKKTFRGLIALIIVGLCSAIICFCGAGSQVNGEWFKNGNVMTWFNSWGKGSDIPDTGEDETNNTLIAVSSDGIELHSGHSYAMPSSLAVLRTAETSSTYSAESKITVYASLTNQYIRGYYDYSVAFVNAESTWATGKNVEDYVTVAPAGEDERAAEITFLKSFGEQIQVIATLRGSNKTGVCLVDCVKLCAYNNVVCYTDIEDFNEAASTKVDFKYGVGTVEGDYYLNLFHINLSDNFIERFYDYLTFTPVIHGYQLRDTSIKLSVDESANLLEFYTHVQYSDFISDFENYSEAQQQAIYYAWYHATTDLAMDTFEVGFSVDYYYNGQRVVNGSLGIDDGIFDLRGAGMGKDIAPDVNFNTNVVF